MPKTNHDPEYLLAKLRGISLSREARSRMRAELSAYADLHKAKAPVPSTSVFPWLSIHYLRAPIALLLILVLAGGTAYASDDALPGSPLYHVKIGVTERLELALAITDELKAEVHAEHAEKRLEEAEELALAQKLDEKTQEYLEQKFSTHIDRSLAVAEKLEGEGDVEASHEVRSKLEARLVAHSEILDLVEDKLQESGEDAKLAHESAEDLIRALRVRQEVVAKARLALEDRLDDDATPTRTLALVTEASEAPARAKDVHIKSVAKRVAEVDTALEEVRESLEKESPENTRLAFRKALEAERTSGVITTLMKYRDILEQVSEEDEREATTTPEAPEMATTTEATTTPMDPEASGSEEERGTWLRLKWRGN